MKNLLILILSIGLWTPTFAQTKIKQEGDSLLVLGDSSYTITSKNGKKIGINTTKKQKTHVKKNGKRYIIQPEEEMESLYGCGAASNLVTNAVSNVYHTYGNSCDLYVGWTGGGGEVVAIYVNSQPYRDGNSGYGLWTSSCTGIACEAPIIGGITAGKTFNVFIRTYCNQDTTGSARYDSPVKNYIVPSTFQCTSGSTATPQPKKGKGH